MTYFGPPYYIFFVGQSIHLTTQVKQLIFSSLVYHKRQETEIMLPPIQNKCHGLKHLVWIGGSI